MLQICQNLYANDINNEASCDAIDSIDVATTVLFYRTDFWHNFGAFTEIKKPLFVVSI